MGHFSFRMLNCDVRHILPMCSEDCLLGLSLVHFLICLHCTTVESSNQALHYHVVTM